MKRFFVKILAMLLACIFVISGINFSIFASDTISPGNLGDRLVAANVAITGRIKLWFYFADTQNVQRYVVEIPGEDSRTVYVSNMAESVKNGDTRRVLEVSLAAAQQAVKVKVTPYAADGTAGKPREYSVMDYANQVIDLAAKNSSYKEAAEALKSMLNYGAMSQLAFDRYTDVLANKGLYFGATNPINNMSIDDVYGVEKMEKSATNPLALDLGNVNAYLKDSISLKFYLNYTCNKSALRVTIEDQDCGNEINSDETGDYILIDNIPATKFNYQYTVKVSDGSNTLTFKCSVLNYVKSLIAMDGTDEAEEYGITEDDINAAYSMFQYYVKMWEYVNKGTAEAEPVGKPAHTACDHKRSYVDTKLGYTEICSDCGKDVTPTNIVENANKLANGVTAYFGTQDGKVDGSRENYVVENSNMNLYYPLASSQLVTITDDSGNAYVKDTMDVYVETSNGTYYASNSLKKATANIYRYGYYYYDIHTYGQNFIENNISNAVLARKAFSLKPFAKTEYIQDGMPWDWYYEYSFYGSDISCDGSYAQSVYNDSNGTTPPKFKIASTSDPYIYTQGVTSGVSVSSTYVDGKYNAMRINITLDSTSQVQMRYTTTSTEGFGEAHRIDFDTHSGTGEYIVYFEEDTTVYNIRFDFNGATDEEITINSVEFVAINTGTSPALLLDRGFHTYTDKMHQVLSIVAPSADVDVTEVGMTTDVEASKIVIKAKDADPVEYESGALEKGNYLSNVEYVGFQTTAGVFGYILPYGDDSSTITVTYNGDNSYTIKQTMGATTIQKQPTIYSSSDLAQYISSDPSIGTSLNIYNSPSQFYFGQRIYTDTNDNFNAFLEEAYIERNPLTAENIKIDTDKTPDATFDGYDGIRGMYAFTIPENIGFNAGYYYAQNFHGAVSFSITGDEYDRNMYVMAYSYGTSIEGGAVLDKDDTLLPIPTEVSKNFANEFEEPIWLWGDVAYSEVRIPVKVNKGETEELTVLQTYMNWGKYPLKQISTVQFFAPYYHLSTGVTESNCIANYYVTGKDLQTLPDHRAASAFLWSDLSYDRDGNGNIEGTDQNGDGFNEGDPQHDNGGYHYFLQYTSTEGKVTSEPVSSVINSAGLTYADIDMKYVTDDNNIEVTYTHMEMPQTDENRAYYEIKYKVLNQVTINDFANNFSFYSVRGYGSGYQSFSYWNGDDSVVKSLTEDNNGDGVCDNDGRYTLGELSDTSENSYFTFYNIDNVNKKTGYTYSQSANVSFLIDSYQLPSSLSNSKFIVNVSNRSASLSLNADTVTLNEDDEIVIYAIIMPWGDEDSDDDSLVQWVRENTLVNPIVATYEYKGETVISDSFLPTVKSENGLDAMFTIGHKDSNNAPKTRDDNGINVAFRVDGFKVLTVPKLYQQVTDKNEADFVEKVDEYTERYWKLVEISSANSPDISGNAHEYDGYFVHYDADSKTYSYSFVTNINGSSRTFMVLVDDTYVEWEENHSDLYFGADVLYHFADHGSSLTATSMSENGVDFVRLTNGGTDDPATAGFKMVGGSAVKYMVLKYRIDDPDAVDPDQYEDLESDEYKAAVAEDEATDSGLQFFMTTYGTYDGGLAVEKGGDGINDCFTLKNSVVVQDGTWQVMVVDLAALVAESGIGGNMIASDVGTYSLSSFRFDPFTVASTYSIDVEYIAFCRDILDVVEMNSDMDISDISYVSGTTRSSAISDKLLEEEKYADMNVVFVGSELYNQMFGGSMDELTYENVSLTNGIVTTTGKGNVGIFVGGEVATGQYMVIKYRTSSAPTTGRFNIYASAGVDAIENDYKNLSYSYGFIGDGKWHTLVMDLSAASAYKPDAYTVKPATDGKYYINWVRLDALRLCFADTSKVEFEYIGFCDELSDVVLDEDAYADIGWQKWTASIDSVKMDGADATKNACSYMSGASQLNALTGSEWAMSGWFAVDGQNVTDVSVCVTDEAGKEHWTLFGTPSERTDLTNFEENGVVIGNYAEVKLGYATGTLCYGVNVNADLSAYHGQTVNVSVRVLTEDGFAVTIYSVFVDVPSNKKLDVIFTGSDIVDQATDNYGDDANYTVVDNGNGTATFKKTGNGAANFTIRINAEGAEPIVTGKYLIIKYRINSSSVVANSNFYAGTDTYSAINDDQLVSAPVVNDGEWHIMAVDLSQAKLVTEGADGYTVNFVRVDLGSRLSVGDTVDYEYIGVCDDLGDVDASTTIFGEVEMGQKFAVSYDAGTAKGDPISSVNINKSIVFDITSENFECNGWLGTTFTTYTLVYKVINGNDSTEWITIDGGVWTTTESGVISGVESACGTGSSVWRFRVPTIDLSEYNCKTVKLCIAMANVTDGEIEYLTMIYDINVTVPYTASPNYFDSTEMAGVVRTDYYSADTSSGYLKVTNSAVSDGNGTIIFSDLMTGTPQYAVIRYKNTEASTLCIYATTTDKTHKENFVTLKKDGAWHVVVVDLTSVGSYTPGVELNLLRFDVIEGSSDVNKSIIFDYVWFTDVLDEVEYEEYDKFNVSYTGAELANKMQNGANGNYGITVTDDGTVLFERTSASYKNAAGTTVTEAYFTTSIASGTNTGRYLVVKYKATSANTISSGIFASTTNTGATGNGDVCYGVTIRNDGEWHVLVFDLSVLQAVSDTDGEYYVKFVRLDFGSRLAVGDTIEYGYIGLCDDFSNLGDITVIHGRYKNNVDYLLVDDATNVNTQNLRGSAEIYGTKVHYTGWAGIDNTAATGVHCTIIDAEGNETVVESAPSYAFTKDDKQTGTECTWNLKRSDLDSQFGSYSSTTITSVTQGFGGSLSVDLSAWAGQKVTLSLRATTEAGYVAEFFSVIVNVPESQ